MRRGVIVKALKCCAESNCGDCPLEQLREGIVCTTKLAKEVLEQMRADDEARRKQYAQTLPKAIAIDFDGCLCANAYPDIGAPNWEIIVAAAAEQIAGAGLILWTCREGELLENALEACARWGLHFDAVNDSLPSWKQFYGNDTRKGGATEYWDDKAYRVQNGKLMKERRKELGMTQMQLAVAVGASSVALVSSWERGCTVASVPKLKKLAEVLGVTMEQLLEEEE